ncbi:MAG: hypothetical protein ACO1RX_05325 [Candidatus Sericytochromatia bacterium]
MSAPSSPSQKTRSLLLLGALCYVVIRLLSKDPFFVSHYVHLPIHEAGHLIFMPFGEFMHFLGGSLFQSVFPLAFSGHFLKQRDFFAACLILIWSGDSLIDVSFYVGDAYLQKMPLLGGEHDWAVLLGMLDLTHHADFLGALTWWAGALLMLAAWSSAFLVLNHQAGWIRIRST